MPVRITIEGELTNNQFAFCHIIVREKPDKKNKEGNWVNELDPMKVIYSRGMDLSPNILKKYPNANIARLKIIRVYEKIRYTEA